MNLYLLYNHLEERHSGNVREYLNSDTDYQEALAKECEFFQQYESLNLSKEQCLIIERWGEAITARNGAYSAIIFRMGMQCCFSLLMQLADLK